MSGFASRPRVGLLARTRGALGFIRLVREYRKGKKRKVSILRRLARVFNGFLVLVTCHQENQLD